LRDRNEGLGSVNIERAGYVVHRAPPTGSTRRRPRCVNCIRPDIVPASRRLRGEPRAVVRHRLVPPATTLDALFGALLQPADQRLWLGDASCIQRRSAPGADTRRE
jgi:hypothetical protein